MGKEFEAVTHEINRRASVTVAKMAARAGVKNFVFASSCSMYGAADGGAPRSERDATNPLTAYARSKIGTEVDLAGEDLGGMTFTSLRFATACGMSERLRLDLVLNDFVACALLDKKITVLSDGSPWRPVIDVEDMGRVIWWACNRDSSDGGQFLAVNAGRDEGNYQVRDLASAGASAIGGVDVAINTAAPPDGRSYKVDFTLLRSLAPNAVPRVSLEESIQRLTAGIKQLHFKDSDFRNSSYIRLHLLRKHIAAGRLAADLRWSDL
jgi:nucleoside-diphosphate-sugar epimerase